MKKILIISAVAIALLTVSFIAFDSFSKQSLIAKKASLSAIKNDFSTLVFAAMPENVNDTYATYTALTQNKTGELSSIEYKLKAISVFPQYSLIPEIAVLKKEILEMKQQLQVNVREYQEITAFTDAVSVSLDDYYALRTDYTKKDVSTAFSGTTQNSLESKFTGYANINMFAIDNSFYENRKATNTFTNAIADIKEQQAQNKAAQLQQLYLKNLEEELTISEKLYSTLVTYTKTNMDIQTKYSETIGNKFKYVACLTKCINLKAANKKKYDAIYAQQIKELKTMLSKNNEELRELYKDWKADWL